MRQNEIIKGRSYLNKSGRTERLVLEVGTNITIRWFGDKNNEPKGEAVVLFVETRAGKTTYGERSGKSAHSMYVSAFSSWAKSIVPIGDEAHHNYSEHTLADMIAKAMKRS